MWSIPCRLAEPLLAGKIEVLPWETALHGTQQPVDGLFIYGHPAVDGPLLDRLPGLKVISNPGVIPLKFKVPGGGVAEVAPRKHFKID